MTTRENTFYSRGNTAIGALVLIVLIGIGTAVFDSKVQETISVHPSAFIALAAMPTDRGACFAENDQWTCEKDAQNETCVMGEDYLIRFKDGQVASNLAQTKKIAYIAKTIDGRTANYQNQCLGTSPSNPVTGVPAKSYNGEPIPYRLCKNTGPEDKQWKCYVTFCKPKGFSGDALNQEECITIPKSIGVGVRAQNAMDSSGFTSDLQKIAANGTAEEKAAVSPYLPPTGASAQSGVLNGFDEAQKKLLAAEDALLDAQVDLEVAKEESREICGQWITWASTCENAQAAVLAAEENVKANEEYYKSLSEQADSLKDSQKSLTSGSNSIEEELKKPCPFPSPEFGCYGNTSAPAKESNTFQNCPGGPNCPGGTWDPNKGQLEGGGGGNQPPASAAPRANSGSGFNLGQLMPLLSSALKLFQGTQTAAQPSCKLTVTPANVEAGKPATLSWTTENAQAAYLSNQGQVGPSGSIQIQPQYSTTYSMQVTGYPQQVQQQQQPYNPYTNPYGQQPQGQYVWNPYLGEYTYVQAPPQQYGQPNGQAYSSQPAQPAGPPPQAQCSMQVTVGAASATTTAAKPKAQISCQPRLADVGMQVALSFACQNSAASVGRGFSTGGQLSGSASAVVEKPALGTRAVTYGLTCSKDGQMDSAECTVEIHRSSVVLVANPKVIQPGETTNVGWVTSGMESCTISSPDLQPFTEANENNFSTGGTAKTPVLGQNTKFVLTCTTKAGGTKIAETEVVVGR